MSWVTNMVDAALVQLDELRVERDALKQEVERLTARNAELLAAMVRLTNELPYSDEFEGWESQRAAMLVEIGTLRAELRERDRSASAASPVQLPRATIR